MDINRRNVKERLGKLVNVFATLLPKNHVPVYSPGGLLFLNLSESNMMILRALGLYELKKRLLIRRIIKQGMITIDVGANKGYFTLYLAKRARVKMEKFFHLNH
jgi:hypothetical protein